MINRPKVSVILPSLNVHQYIRECVESVINQSLEDIEIICVDAGSTDGTLEIIREYAEKDPRIKVIVSDKKSYGYQMNLGFDNATGEYVGIVETDDYVPANMYADLYSKAKELKLDFIKADFYRFSVNEDGSLNKSYNRLSPNPEYYNVVLCPGEDYATFRFIMNTWSGIYSVDFLKHWNIRHNETPGASYQDNGFWFQTFCRAERAYFLDVPYYMNRRDNPNSSVYSKSKVYAMRDEYDYIRSIIDNDLERLGKFIPLCNYFRFCGYRYNTVDRVSEEFKAEFVNYFSNEFRALADNGELDRDLFGNSEWNYLLQVMYDPASITIPKSELTRSCSKRVLKYSDDEDTCTFSVIVPVYNVEEYLEECLNSLLAQTFKDMEIICVDDGSTDASADILHRYAKADSRVVVLRQENMGLSAARNTGLMHARGKYICFVDSDDGLTKRALKTLYRETKAHNAEIVVFGFDATHYPISGSVPAWLESKNPVRNVTFLTFVPEILFSEPGGRTFTWRNCYERNFLRRHGFFFAEQIKFGEDTVFQMEVIPHAKNIRFIKDKLYYYRIARPGSLMSNHNSDALLKSKHHIELIEYLRQSWDNYGILNTMRSYFAGWALGFALDGFDMLNEAEKKTFGRSVISIMNKIAPGELQKILGPWNLKKLEDLKVLCDQKTELVYEVLSDGDIGAAAESPKVSIIVPVHNMCEYIENTLISLLGQSLNEIEVICINDASTDGTGDILNRFSEQDARLRVITYTENKSASQARKDGVKAARGKYILFCDGDDSYASDSILELYNEMERCPVDILHFGTNVINCAGDEEDKIWLDSNLSPFFGMLLGDDVFAGCFRKKLYGTTLWNKMYSASLAKKAFDRVEDGSFPRGQDIYGFVLLAYYARSYRGISGCFAYNYHLGRGGDGRKSLSVEEFKRFCSLSKVVDALERFFEDEGVSDQYADVLFGIRSAMLGDCINKWQKKVSIKNKGQCLDELLASWPGWAVADGIARRYWDDFVPICEVLKDSALSNIIKKDVKTVGMYYHRINGGGVEVVMQQLSKILTAMGHEVVIITDIQSPSDFFPLPVGVRRRVVPNDGSGNSKAYYRRARKLYEIVRDENIDVVIYHAWNTELMLWDMLCIKSAGAPCMVHCHSVFSLRLISGSSYFSVLPHVMGFADGVICLSEADRSFWHRFNSNTHIVQNPLGFDVKSIVPSKTEDVTVLWVGRLSYEKHPEEAISIFKYVVDAVPNAKLKLLGASETKEHLQKLEQLAECLGIRSQVEFCGYHNDPRPFYAEASVLLCTSEYEGYYLALMEGKAFGLPVVMYELPYLVITKGNKGILPVRFGDRIAAADAIVNLLTNVDLVTKMRRESREHALELADFDFAAVWKEIFESLGALRDESTIDESEMIMWNTLLEHYQYGLNLICSQKAAERKIEEDFRKEIKTVQDSVSFRVGKMVTYVPRKMFYVYRFFRQYGLSQTVYRVIEKIKSRLGR